MSTSIEKAKDRIRKLLEVAKDDASTNGEIENALSFAKKMMDAHHLSEEDLAVEPEDQYKDIENAPKGKKAAYVGRKLFQWESGLAAFVKKFVGGVGCYHNPNKEIIRKNGIAQRDYWGEIAMGKSFVYYGIEEDVELAVELYEELRTTISGMATLKFGGCYKGNGGTYAEGFVAGLFTKIEEQDKVAKIANQGNSRALVLVERRNDLINRKSEVAEQWLTKTTGIKLQKGYANYGASGSAAAYSEGRSDGQRSNVSGERKPKIC